MRLCIEEHEWQIEEREGSSREKRVNKMRSKEEKQKKVYGWEEGGRGEEEENKTSELIVKK